MPTSRNCSGASDPVKPAAALLATLVVLPGCSYGYDVRAVVIDGRLAFVSEDADFTCVANIRVTATDTTRATPSPADNQAVVINGGDSWSTKAPVVDCTMDFPIFYGSAPARVRQSVLPKPLRVGVTYSIDTEGHGAYGFGCFRISEIRRVENLPRESCY